MNIQDILLRTSELRIAVIGDLIHDEYVTGEVTRISPEAPVQILRVTGRSTNPGGAGNVVENLRRLGCEVSFFHQEKVPTKTRIMSSGHHLLRIDDEAEPEWMKWDEIDIGLGYGIEQQKYNCVVISDYGKGCISEEVAIEVIGRCAQHGIPVVVDSKQHPTMFAEATVFKCNQREWDKYEEDGGTKPWVFMQNNFVDNVVITRGQHGVTYWGPYGGNELSGNIPGHHIQISDACGSGDTTTSILAMMTALGEPLSDACELANIAAAEVCKRPGVYAIQKEDLLKYQNNGSKI